MVWIALALVLTAGGIAFWVRRHPRHEKAELEGIAPPGMFIATSTQSQARVHGVLPTAGSEDRRDLLQAPAADTADENLEGYRPSSESDWVVDLAFFPERAMPKAKILEVFHKEWLRRVGSPMLYGKARDGEWTYLAASDAAAAYSQIALGWRLNQDFDPDWKPPKPADYEFYLKEVQDRSALLGATEVKPSLNPPEAAERADSLQELKTRLSHDAIIVLQAPDRRPFDGREIWDVMLSLGLEWGDMDVFHWRNDSSEGGDYWFDVWTTTSPGYFFPEEIAAGKVKAENLVFGFCLPRTRRPDVILESMLRAAEYSKSRLGGTLLTTEGTGFEPDRARDEVRSAARELADAGFPPGAYKTLYLF